MRKAAEDAAAGKRKKVWVHGWVYDLSRGEIRDLHATHGPCLEDQLLDGAGGQIPVEEDQPSLIDDAGYEGR